VHLLNKVERIQISLEMAAEGIVLWGRRVNGPGFQKMFIKTTQFV